MFQFGSLSWHLPTWTEEYFSQDSQSPRLRYESRTPWTEVRHVIICLVTPSGGRMNIFPHKAIAVVGLWT